MRSLDFGWRVKDIRNEVGCHPVDLRDVASVETALHAIRPELVFHLAQHGGYSWQTDLKAMIETNYLAGINVLHAARRAGANVVVNTGSSSEYGLKSHRTHESNCPEPNSDYAATKVAFTLYCQQWARRTGFRVPTLRLYSVYGPFEEPMRLVPRLLSYGLDGRLPPLVAPSAARDFVFVDDVVEAYLRATMAPLPDPGAIYNICSGRQTTLQEAVDVAQGVLNISVEPSWRSMPSRAWDTEIWCGDPARARGELGWYSTTTLESGLHQFAYWLQNHPGMREYYREKTAANSLRGNIDGRPE
jgi:dolichol-phosphate mannosyltransferase